MPLAELVALAQQALLLSLLVSLPVLVVAAAVGLLSSIVQAATQVQDAALGHFPKFVAVTIALALVGPWMGRQVLGFAVRAFGGH
ncbi:MAG TPA: type III secretion system export apparatus subunit SctS [Polyangiaceae bacterium]|nr:type III secretion system export apparatus subunit SctS [Polyangiaceae bacterium]